MSFTNFPNGITSFGVPVGAPNIFGKPWFVDSDGGSNSQDGKSPDHPLATLQKAVDLASSWDTIYVAGTANNALTQVDDYDEEVTIPVTKIGITLQGCGGGPEGVLWGPSAENKTLLTINSNNCRVNGFRLRPYGATGHAIDLLRTTTENQAGTIIKNCTFRSQTTPAYGIYSTGGPNDVTVKDCIFDSVLGAIYMPTALTNVPHRWVVKDVQINGNCSSGIDGSFRRSLFERVVVADLDGGMMLDTDHEPVSVGYDNRVKDCAFGDANSAIAEVNGSATDGWQGSYFGKPLDQVLVVSVETGLFLLSPDGLTST